ncbi:Retrovirus-related Pol polyprotein from type-1 retrotransposable element R2 [Stylophora pistillata]|uniref:Retrovirus-related Pol polyprotein from type-1 retrotransposable element R2 n=1 Tax=Stylophora pistillata TaxID=50429 RepID=A0A2B4S382_STYPI|nr:Retrovirus-related Pol polyprotein from type-1 retrotransposable element R2 [Stylophora pistillata]
MADEVTQQPARTNETTRGRRRRGRVIWTVQMNRDLLECKEIAQQLVASVEPPLYPNGRKKGYMRIMWEKWNEKGYAGLDFSSQNLRDQAGHLEKSKGNVRDTIIRSLESPNNEQSEEGNFISQPEIMSSNMQQSTQNAEVDLHIASSTQTPLGPNNASINTSTGSDTSIDEVPSELAQLPAQFLASVKQSPGDFSGRCYDPRTKQKPTGNDIDNVNTAVRELLKCNMVPDPSEDPFGYLRMANCVLYSVIIAFYVFKGWKKKESNKDEAGRSKFNEMAKEKYEGQASKIRAKLSKAKAEIERIKTNGEITKKGKRNRAELKKVCKTLTVANLVAYMEKEKSKLRRLKRGYRSRKKQHEARQINRQFQLDRRRVYGKLKGMVEAQGDSDKPKYDHGLQDNRRQDRMFTNIEEAASFWRSLWEAEGTGDTGADWLEEVRCAIREKVPEPTEENFTLKGKSSLVPKLGEFNSANQRPITCLNTMYKWFSSWLLKPVDQHLDTYGLMEGGQRGAKENCSGTMNNFLVDRMVCQDSQRGRRKLSMAWVDVRKAYGSVDYKWLKEMFALHHFSTWIGNLIARLCARWNTKITAVTKQGVETSERIAFRKGLPQGDALCPRLFTLCLNPIAWKLKASEGYRLSKPISAKITDLLYIDDLEIYAASEAKLERIMKGVRNAMEDVGLQWNERKCAVVHVRRGRLQEPEENGIGAGEAITLCCIETMERFTGRVSKDTNIY